jgi:hypothetical protein
MTEPTQELLSRRHDKPIAREARLLIDELRFSAVRPDPRAACERVLGDLLDLQFAYATKMGAAWDWLEQHRGHKKYDEREEAWLGWLATYEAVWDAVRAYGPKE